MFTFMRIFAITTFAATCSLAYALDANDVANMTKAKAGDEVIIAQLKATKARFTLTADDIIRLKKEGVSDAVIKVMIESAATQQASEPTQPPTERPAAQPEPARASVPEQAPVRIVEREPQPVQTTIIERHYYQAPPQVYYYTAPTTTYYVPSRPAYSPGYRYDNNNYYRGGDRYGLSIGGSVRLGRNVRLGFRL